MTAPTFIYDQAECFIPLTPEKRKRSRAILAEAARRFTERGYAEAGVVQSEPAGAVVFEIDRGRWNDSLEIRKHDDRLLVSLADGVDGCSLVLDQDEVVDLAAALLGWVDR